MDRTKKAMLLRLGIEARLEALEQEKKDLLKELGATSTNSGGKSEKSGKKRGPYKKRDKRKSEAYRRAMSNRMKRMWAEKRRKKAQEFTERT